MNQEEFDKIQEEIKNMTCSICHAPEHSNHTFDKVYFNEGKIIAVTNNKCEKDFNNAFTSTFCEKEYITDKTSDDLT
jgi:hypothetical protein